MNKYLAYTLSVIVFLGIVVGFTYWLTSTEEQAGGGEEHGEEAGTEVNAEEVFAANCASCHGQNLEGQVGPALNKVGGKYSQEEILGIIQNGKGGGMPAGVIKGKEAEAVAKWLSEKK
nr:cytochrome c [Pseudalkalibacillus caeni]